jgi:hypothetical protein
MMTTEINCAVDCTRGCRLGEDCPSKGVREGVSQFIESRSLDEILAIAEESVRRKALERSSQTTQWVFPEDGIQP